MTEPIVIGVGQNKWIKDANTRMYSFYALANAGGTYDAFKDKGTDYIVPVGKKFIILNHSSTPYNTATTVSAEFTLYEHTTPSVVGGIKLQTNMGALGEGNVGLSVDMYIEVPAGKYINLRNGGTGIAYDTITGVETDV